MARPQTPPDFARREVIPRGDGLRWWLLSLMTLLVFQPASSFAQPGGRGGDALGAIFGRDEEEIPRGSGPSLSASDELVADIRIEGTRAIPQTRVLSQLSTRIGRPFDEQLVRKDVRKLVDLPWFVDVQTYTDRTPEGLVVVFKVVERPTIRYVEYWGNNSIRDKKLAKETGLTVGGTLDPFSVNEGRNRIEQVYRDNGFTRVQVTVVEGAKAGDKGVVYSINEGTQKKIWGVEFEGNQFASDGQLKTRVKAKPGFGKFLFGGYLDRDQLDADKQLLTDYYRSFGYFQAKADPILEWGASDKWVTIRWIIYEGPQSQVRNVSIMGNQLFATEDLVTRLKLPGGQQFERTKVQGDVEWLKQLYGSRGYVFTDVQADVRFLEEPGQVDLVYTIEEGKRFRVGRVVVHIGGENPHTRIQTALNRLSIRPGEIADIREFRASERRLMQSALFHNEPMRNIYPKISFRIPDPEKEVYQAEERSSVRGQSPDPPLWGETPLRTFVIDNSTPVEPGIPTVDMEVTIDELGQVEVTSTDAPAPVEHVVRREPIPIHTPEVDSPYADLRFDQPARSPYHTTGGESTARGQSPQPEVRWTSVDPAQPQPVAPGVAQSGVAPAQFAPPSLQPQYGGYAVQPTSPTATSAPSAGVQPTQYIQQLPPPALPSNTAITPYPMPDAFAPGAPTGMPVPFQDNWVDIDVHLQETQTGRFVMGVGVNSDAGVVGQILLDEKNFDWRRPPGSWQDVWDGTAWRGGGQRFRLEAAPGSQVQRYLVSFQEPYFLDTPVSLTLSGSYYDRRFEDWDERRLGGRVGVGYQWTQSDVSTNLSYRGEEVKITRPSNPLEPQLDEVLGSNMLHGFRLAVVNNTRDSDFLPTQGHYFEIYGEQVVGTFDYPRGGFDLRKYFLMHERGDHTGRHVLSLTTQVNITGNDTPIYEHFFAGGFSTMRGFDFRGASPVAATGVTVGGEFQWLNSAEYMFPLTADDMLHGVVFCDFGTTEPDISVDSFRVAPGVGMRITIPAMGPAPIALDFAWPVVREDTDDLQVFSFNIGFLR